MEERREKGMYPNYVFVGEKRSRTAIENNWTWKECQEIRKPRLCAIRLFKAMIENGIKPENQTIVNLWNDNGELDETIIETLRKTIEEGTMEIVGMGRRVQRQLTDLNISHRELPHPAARGNNLKEGEYTIQMRQTLFK